MFDSIMIFIALLFNYNDNCVKLSISLELPDDTSKYINIVYLYNVKRGYAHDFSKLSWTMQNFN